MHRHAIPPPSAAPPRSERWFDRLVFATLRASLIPAALGLFVLVGFWVVVALALME